MKADERDFLELTGALFILVLMIGLPLFFAYNEAKSYRKFCDKDVTTWDALFLDLRIDECDKNEH